MTEQPKSPADQARESRNREYAEILARRNDVIHRPRSWELWGRERS